MPKTKSEAVKDGKKFLKMHPDLDVIIIKHKSVPKGNALRYNYRFSAKRSNKNKLLFVEEL